MTILMSTKMTGHEAASCPLGGLPAVCGVVAPSGVVNELPATAQGMAAGQAPVYGVTAVGAPTWQRVEGLPSFGAAPSAKRWKIRAFRGLEPWRDPA